MNFCKTWSAEIVEKYREWLELQKTILEMDIHNQRDEKGKITHEARAIIMRSQELKQSLKSCGYFR